MKILLCALSAVLFSAPPAPFAQAVNDHDKGKGPPPPNPRAANQANGRRAAPLGGSSPGASKADCTGPVDIRLFADSPSSVRFVPSQRSCITGKVFAGASADGNSHVTLVPGSDGKFAASVVNDDTGAVYSIAPDANGVMTVVERLQEDYGPELDPEDDPLTKDERERALSSVSSPSSPSGLRGQLKDLGDKFLADQEQENGGDGAPGRSLQGNTVMDVYVVWTAHAECRNAGLARGCTLTAATEASMRSRINLAVQETNTAYTNSGVNAELNLLLAEYIQYTEASADAFGTALSQLRSTTDGIMDSVHATRSSIGADLVALIIDDSQYCGIAYLGPSPTVMFSVTAWNCATGYYSFGHEIGHNLGCNHDRGTTGQCTNTNYNYGWRDPQARFRSILAYNCGSGQCDNNAGGGCTRVMRFSNPSLPYNGNAIGDAQNDNARRINDVKDTVAAYYTSGPPTTRSPTTPPTPFPTSPPTQCLVEGTKCQDVAGNCCTGLSCPSSGNPANRACEPSGPAPTPPSPTPPTGSPPACGAKGEACSVASDCCNACELKGQNLKCT